MKAFNFGWSIAVATLVAATIGCGHQGDDPGKDYTDIRNRATVNADPNNKPTPVTITKDLPPQQEIQKICMQPFRVAVKGERTKHLLTFAENKETSYEITVFSNMGPQFNVETENLSSALSADFHAGRAKFTLVKQEGNVGTYNFTWKPAKLRNGDDGIQPLDLRYTSAPSKVCGSDIRETLSLVVQPENKSVTLGGDL